MRKIMIFLLFTVLACSLSLSNFVVADTVDLPNPKEHIVFSEMRDFVTANPYRKTATDGAKSAAEYIDQRFKEFGLESEIQEFEYEAIVGSEYYYTPVIEKRKDRNVIARITTDQDTADTVVIGAHYDNNFVDGTGCGVYDNGSGIGILLGLAKNLQENKNAGRGLPFNVEFVAFGAQSYAIRGSDEYLKSLRGSDINSILLYINLDSVSAGDNLYVYADEVRTIQEDYFVTIADEKGINLQRPPINKGIFQASISNLGYAHAGLSSDNVNFINRGILSVSFSSHNWTGYSLGGTDESADKPNVRETANDNIKDIEELYGLDAWQKMVDVYDIVYSALYQTDFAHDMRIAKIENPDYSILTNRYLFSGICAGFLAIVTAVVLAVSKKKTKEQSVNNDKHGEGGDQPPKVFAEFD